MFGNIFFVFFRNSNDNKEYLDDNQINLKTDGEYLHSTLEINNLTKGEITYLYYCLFKS